MEAREWACRVVRQLQERLGSSTDTEELCKSLRLLSVLPITPEILAATGVSRTVEGLRTQPQVGVEAQALVQRWETLAALSRKSKAPSQIPEQDGVQDPTGEGLGQGEQVQGEEGQEDEDQKEENQDEEDQEEEREQEAEQNREEMLESSSEEVMCQSTASDLLDPGAEGSDTRVPEEVVSGTQTEWVWGALRQLQQHLTSGKDGEGVRQSLRLLSVLPITPEMLAATGVRKTVEGFRKHPRVGTLAQELAMRWETLVLLGRNSKQMAELLLGQVPGHRGAPEPRGEEEEQQEGEQWKKVAAPFGESWASDLADPGSQVRGPCVSAAVVGGGHGTRTLSVGGAEEQLQRRPASSPNADHVRQVLRMLSILPVTPEVLAASGIRRTVKAFRKHPQAGGLAKELAKRWKTLALLAHNPKLLPALLSQVPEPDRSHEPKGNSLDQGEEEKQEQEPREQEEGLEPEGKQKQEEVLETSNEDVSCQSTERDPPDPRTQVSSARVPDEVAVGVQTEWVWGALRQLQERLASSTHEEGVRQSLRLLSVLPITPEMLAATGVRRTVEGFRKHPRVGTLAQELAMRWETLALLSHKPALVSALLLCHVPEQQGPPVPRGEGLGLGEREGETWKETAVAPSCQSREGEPMDPGSQVNPGSQVSGRCVSADVVVGGHRTQLEWVWGAVLQLQERLASSSNAAEVRQALSLLSVLPITPQMLAATELRRTAKAFRKHPEVGCLAKEVVKRWKTLALLGRNPALVAELLGQVPELEPSKAAVGRVELVLAGKEKFSESSVLGGSWEKPMVPRRGGHSCGPAPQWPQEPSEIQRAGKRSASPCFGSRQEKRPRRSPASPGGSSGWRPWSLEGCRVSQVADSTGGERFLGSRCLPALRMPACSRPKPGSLSPVPARRVHSLVPPRAPVARRQPQVVRPAPYAKPGTPTPQPLGGSSGPRTLGPGSTERLWQLRCARQFKGAQPGPGESWRQLFLRLRGCSEQHRPAATPRSPAIQAHRCQGGQAQGLQHPPTENASSQGPSSWVRSGGTATSQGGQQLPALSRTGTWQGPAGLISPKASSAHTEAGGAGGGRGASGGTGAGAVGGKKFHPPGLRAAWAPSGSITAAPTAALHTNKAAVKRTVQLMAKAIHPGKHSLPGR